MATYKITSTDGTVLACEQTGVGTPLVLVHGTGGSATRWRPVLPSLAQHFSTYALDRRWRGESGDGPNYVMEREFEDVATVATSLGAGVNLLGHSFGGVCSLEAALRVSSLRKLILYEPPIPVPGISAPSQAPGLIDRLEALLAVGDRESVLLTFVKEVLHMSPEGIAAYKASPAWPSRLAAAHTLPREMRTQGQYHFQAERFKDFQVPTLLLLGGDSLPHFKAAIDLLAKTLPHNRVVVLPGQQHMAMDTAPELFVKEVLKFLEEV